MAGKKRGKCGAWRKQTVRRILEVTNPSFQDVTNESLKERRTGGRQV